MVLSVTMYCRQFVKKKKTQTFRSAKLINVNQISSKYAIYDELNKQSQILNPEKNLDLQEPQDMVPTSS